MEMAGKVEFSFVIPAKAGIQRVPLGEGWPRPAPGAQMAGVGGDSIANY